MEMAPAAVGATREGCHAYIGHFLRHWAHGKAAHTGNVVTTVLRR
jgi:hypothetical protein